MAAPPAQPRRQEVDIRHDFARQRNLALMARLDEIVLHVDHEQGGFARLDRLEWVRFAHPLRHAVACGGRDRDLVHRCVLN